MKYHFLATAAVVCAATAVFATSYPLSEAYQRRNTILLSPGQMMLMAGPPANQNSILFNATWDKQVKHSEDSPVDCLSPASEYSSQCIAVLRVDAPKGATHAMLKVKAKSWVTNAKSEGGFNYSLIYASAPILGEVANHFIHSETFGLGPDGQSESRRVEFTNVFVPIIDGCVTISIGKEVVGKSQVEVAIYLTGFVSSIPTRQDSKIL